MNAIPPRGLNGPDDIPKAWKTALAGLRQLFPEAVLAGGALRDRDNGVKVNDLDIFIKAPEDSIASLDLAKQVMEKAGWSCEVQDCTVYAEWFGSSNRLIGIIETRHPGCPIIQVIVGNFEMENLLSYFDFGSSQIMFDGQVIKKTVDYDHDFSRKQFRLVTVCDDKQFSRRVDRYARLKAKYPDWKFHPGVFGESLGLLAGQTIRTMHGV